MKEKRFDEKLAKINSKLSKARTDLYKYPLSLVIEVEEDNISYVNKILKYKQIIKIRELLIKKHKLGILAFRHYPRKIYDKPEIKEAENYYYDSTFVPCHQYEEIWAEGIDKGEIGFSRGWRIFCK